MVQQNGDSNSTLTIRISKTVRDSGTFEWGQNCVFLFSAVCLRIEKKWKTAFSKIARNTFYAAFNGDHKNHKNTQLCPI